MNGAAQGCDASSGRVNGAAQGGDALSGRMNGAAQLEKSGRSS